MVISGLQFTSSVSRKSSETAMVTTKRELTAPVFEAAYWLPIICRGRPITGKDRNGHRHRTLSNRFAVIRQYRLFICSSVASIFSRHSLFLGWLLRVDLIKWVSNVRLYIRPSTKRFFDFNKIWYIGRDRWVMHDGMQYDPIQGQDQGHDSRSLQSRKSGHF